MSTAAVPLSQVREIENFRRCPRALCCACIALCTLDKQVQRESDVQRCVLRDVYADLFEWLARREFSLKWRFHTNGRSSKDNMEAYEDVWRDVQVGFAVDEFVNYAVERPIVALGVTHLVHNVSTFIFTVARSAHATLLNNDHEKWNSAEHITAERLNIASTVPGATCKMDARDPCSVILVPLHSEESFHWSLVVFYRIRTDRAFWYAIHYDTLYPKHMDVANECYASFCYLVRNFVDKSVIFIDPLRHQQNIYHQSEGWTCGYRVAVLADHLVRTASAYDLQMQDLGVEERERRRKEEGDCIEYRFAAQIESAAFLEHIGDYGCARLIAEILDDVRAHEFVESVKKRCTWL